MYLGFLPWTLIESLRELGDWWAFCDEVEQFERNQKKLNEKLKQPLKFDQSQPQDAVQKPKQSEDKKGFFSVIIDDDDS